MSPEELRENIRDRSALPDAWRALALVDTGVRTDFFGRVEGIDTVHLALNALAYPLARLFPYPLDATEAPRIEDVLAFVASFDLIDEEAVDLLRQVQAGIKQWTYNGLPEEGEVYDLETARHDLHGRLEALLTAVENTPEEEEDG